MRNRFPRPDHGHEAVVPLVDFFHEPAVMQRVEQPEAHPFPEPGALDDIAQAEHFAGRLERLQNRGGVHQRLHEIAIVSSVGHRGEQQDTKEKRKSENE